jgi:hypothetical protein
MKAEIARIKAKKPMELMQTERYTLPAPTPGLRHDPEAWNKAGSTFFVSSITVTKFWLS